MVYQKSDAPRDIWFKEFSSQNNDVKSDKIYLENIIKNLLRREIYERAPEVSAL